MAALILLLSLSLLLALALALLEARARDESHDAPQEGVLTISILPVKNFYLVPNISKFATMVSSSSVGI